MAIRYGIVLLSLFFTGQAFAQDHHGDEEKGASKGEVRVYLGDKDQKPVDLKGITATVILEPVGGKKRTLKTEVVAPEGSKKKGLGQGGEVRAMGDYFVEFVVVKAHGGHEEEGHGHKKKDATPYFESGVDLVSYVCSMCAGVQLDEPGKCPKCGMKTQPENLEFSAVVIFRIGGKTLNVKGFQYPPAVPDNFEDAIARVEEHLEAIQELIESGDLDGVHAVAEKISHVCEKLPELAPHDDEADVAKICKEIVGLFGEIDEAADAGKKSETIEVFERYKSKVAKLKKHAGHEGHSEDEEEEDGHDEHDEEDDGHH